MIQSAFDDLKRMNKRQVKKRHLFISVRNSYVSYCICFGFQSNDQFRTNKVMINYFLSVHLPSAELWDDRFIRVDDLEGSHGGYR